MHMDIVDLRQFYATPLGMIAQKSIGQALSTVWRPLSDERLVGLGFATPFLDQFKPDSERTLALMPARQGAVHWQFGESCATALVFDEDLPLPDSSIDRMLLVHALEHCENASETLTEIWRVMAPGGRLVIVVPNRRGVWARVEQTPFGAGRPYTGGQLTRLLREHMFTPTAWSDALHYPPHKINSCYALLLHWKDWGVVLHPHLPVPLSWKPPSTFIRACRFANGKADVFLSQPLHHKRLREIFANQAIRSDFK